MSCCGARTLRIAKAAVSEPVAPTKMLYTVSRTTLTGLDSKERSLLGPLVLAPGKPSKGWRVVLPVNGQSIYIEGVTPADVYNRSLLTLRNNGVNISPADLWTSLNIQWMERTPDKHHMVPLRDLLMVARVRTPGVQVVADSRRRSYKPESWGKYAWGWLNLFLAREDFHFRDFLTQLLYVVDILNPDTNPEIGCAECYRDFRILVEDYKKNPGFTREDARKWLVDAHNSVNRKLGKKELNYEQASKAAFWT
jgi:hypothetical protein